jgi:hypothetical protein
MSRFDHNIKQYYEQQTLAGDKVEAILAQTAHKHRRGRRRFAHRFCRIAKPPRK